MSEVKVISSESEIALPDLFVCPICGQPIYVSEVNAWTEDEKGDVKAETVKIDCTTAPDIDDAAFEDYLNSHWSMPYVDWLPLEMRVTEWVNARYSWKL